MSQNRIIDAACRRARWPAVKDRDLVWWIYWAGLATRKELSEMTGLKRSRIDQMVDVVKITRGDLHVLADRVSIAITKPD